jgi:hypothetical protein
MAKQHSHRQGVEMTALEQYNADMASLGEHDPIERLRFFLSFALIGQDWLDVEQFIDGVSQQLAEREKQIVMLLELIPKRIPNGFVSFGKYYFEQEDKFNNPHNPMCKFKATYLSDCETALAATQDLKDCIICDVNQSYEMSEVTPDGIKAFTVYKAGKL